MTLTHVTVVNEVWTHRFAWEQVDAFEAQRVLFDIPVTGDPVPVAGLPAGNLHRVFFGRSSEVDRLARILNPHLAARSGT